MGCSSFRACSSAPVLSKRCKGVSSPVPGALPPYRSLTLVLTGLFLTFFFIIIIFLLFFFLISHCLCSVLHFPKYVFCKVTPVCLRSSAVVGLLELTGTGCVWPGGLPTEGPLACPPLPRAGHGHAVQ